MAVVIETQAGDVLGHSLKHVHRSWFRGVDIVHTDLLISWEEGHTVINIIWYLAMTSLLSINQQASVGLSTHQLSLHIACQE